MTISGAVIRRVDRPADRFTLISNAFHRDMRLSFAARGLGGWLLSHADGFQVTSVSIARQAGVGRNQVRNWLVELEHYGYLRRTRVRLDNGHLGGMVYEIRCSPFPPAQNEETPSSDLRPDGRAPVDRAPVSGHHKKTSPKDNTPKEDHPSGGDGSAAPQAHAGTPVEEPPSPVQEEPMPTRTDPAQAPLFDLPAPEPPSAEARKPAGAQAVLAAYVEAWRENNPDGEPLKAHKGRIARDAKALLSKGEATEEELVAAVQAMASTPFSNLAVQLSIHRRGSRRGVVLGHSIPLPADYEGWTRGAAEDAARRAAEGVSDEVKALRAQYVQGSVA